MVGGALDQAIEQSIARHPAGKRRPKCLACSTEQGRTLPLAGFWHECDRGALTRRTLAEDFRALVDNDGQGYERDLLPHEIADFTLQKTDLYGSLRVDLTEAWVEIEPTDDHGMERRYLTVDDEDGVVILQNWMCVSGAHARKWVQA